MNEWIMEVGEADFDQQVLAASRRQPVLVDFWAGWCGPCKMLMPVLDAVVQSYGGKVLLAKVDTDREQRLAGQWGVRSLPTVKLFRNGEVVDEFMGVQPESAIRALIDKHLPRAADPVLDELEAVLKDGAVDESHLQQAREALAQDPEYPRARLLLARILMKREALDEAEQLLRQLPADLRLSDAVESLQSELQMRRAGGDLDSLRQAVEAQPDDCGLRLRLAAALVAAGQWESGLETYLRVLEKGGPEEKAQAREGLLAAFKLVDDRALVQRYRRQMSSLIF